MKKVIGIIVLSIIGLLLIGINIYGIVQNPVLMIKLFAVSNISMFIVYKCIKWVF